MKIDSYKFTLAGKKWRAVTAATFFFGLFFLDPVILAIAAIITAVLIFDLLRCRKVAVKLPQLLQISPSTIRLSMTAGRKEVKELDCKINTSLPVKLCSPSPFLQFQPQNINQHTTKITLTITPELAGNYKTNYLQVEITSPFKLYLKESFFPLDIQIKVYPRLIEAIIQAAFWLLRGEGRGTGEQSLPFKGAGTEYAETRSYMAGDTLHYVDWKATARRAELMVKEFYIEGSNAAHIIYDFRATGPLSRDQLATTFLNTCLALARQSLPFGFTIHDGKEIKVHLTEENPVNIVKTALQWVLQTAGVKIEELDTLVEPLSSKQIKAMLQKIVSEPLKKALQVEGESLEKGISQPYLFLKRMSQGETNSRNFLLISQLPENITSVLELVEHIQTEHTITIIQPCQPWREMETLEEAYRVYQRFQSLERILHKRGVRLITSLVPG